MLSSIENRTNQTNMAMMIFNNTQTKAFNMESGEMVKVSTAFWNFIQVQSTSKRIQTKNTQQHTPINVHIATRQQ
jgi:hypothetical protein